MQKYMYIFTIRLIDVSVKGYIIQTLDLWYWNVYHELRYIYIVNLNFSLYLMKISVKGRFCDEGAISEWMTMVSRYLQNTSASFLYAYCPLINFLKFSLIWWIIYAIQNLWWKISQSCECQHKITNSGLSI